MGYIISVYSRKTKEKFQHSNMEWNIFNEESNNLVAFSNEEIKLLEKHLQIRGYIFRGKFNALGSLLPERKIYTFEKSHMNIEVALSDSELSFSCPLGEGVTEIYMTAYELETDNVWSSLQGHFSVYDLEKHWQNVG